MGFGTLLCGGLIPVGWGVVLVVGVGLGCWCWLFWLPRALRLGWLCVGVRFGPDATCLCCAFECASISVSLIVLVGYCFIVARLPPLLSSFASVFGVFFLYLTLYLGFVFYLGFAGCWFAGFPDKPFCRVFGSTFGFRFAFELSFVLDIFVDFARLLLLFCFLLSVLLFSFFSNLGLYSRYAACFVSLGS